MNNGLLYLLLCGAQEQIYRIMPEYQRFDRIRGAITDPSAQNDACHYWL